MRRGIATFTLDEGKCPAWLFQKMVRLGREMIEVLIAELGPDSEARDFRNEIPEFSLALWTLRMSIVERAYTCPGVKEAVRGISPEELLNQSSFAAIMTMAGKIIAEKMPKDPLLNELISPWFYHFCTPKDFIGFFVDQFPNFQDIINFHTVIRIKPKNPISCGPFNGLVPGPGEFILPGNLKNLRPILPSERNRIIVRARIDYNHFIKKSGDRLQAFGQVSDLIFYNHT